jgi:hypothetical protein
LPIKRGDREWFKNPGAEQRPSDADVTVQAESLARLEVKLAAPDERRWRGLQRISPSGLEGGTRVRLSGLRGDSDVDRTSARARGTTIHAWLAQVEWLDDGSPSDERLREIAMALPDLALKPDLVEHWLAEFRAMLAGPSIAACLQRAAYRDFADAQLKVVTERPFAVRDGDRLLVGSIDRLVTVWDGNQPVAAEILEFKTDAITEYDQHALSEKVGFYTPQLQAYCQAVRKMTAGGLQRISAKLLLLEAGMVISVPSVGPG